MESVSARGGHDRAASENPTGEQEDDKVLKPTVVVIMGPTGAGKSKLAIDLATHFPVEIINADSMQVYRGLDVLTNKVSLHDQKGVAHHLLGTVNPNEEFTAKDFRDCAVPLINEILSRNCLPVIVGGTNYYIQALVSPFLLDDTVHNLDDHLPGNEQSDRLSCSYDSLKDLDPVAANRVHPNNRRKINQYLNLYARTGVLPSKLYRGKAAENWGRIENSRFSCCLICIDAATPVLDHYVEQRVDCMIEAGLLNEVCEIFDPNASYTQGLRQAIGVLEFEDFLNAYLLESRDDKGSEFTDRPIFRESANKEKIMRDDMMGILHSSDNNPLKSLLAEAIDKVKANTRRLARLQKRRLMRLQTLFGWNIHYVDATESITCKSDETWAVQVVGAAVKIFYSFLGQDGSSMPDLDAHRSTGTKSVERNLWTQYVCTACGNRVLRGDHEWEQHKQGRGHRKRMSSLKKSQGQGISVVNE